MERIKHTQWNINNVRIRGKEMRTYKEPVRNPKVKLTGYHESSFREVKYLILYVRIE